jgi:hypothetical protein
MYIRLQVKHPLFLSYFKETLTFSTYSKKDTQIPNFMKIHPVGAKLFRVTDGRTDGLTDRREEANSRFS